MVGYKKIIGALLLTTLTGVTVAQNNTNSPYTRYGYGQLADQSFGNSKAMGGISYGLRNGSQINFSNPASYTAIDSLTFLFDGGLTLQNTNFSDGKTKMNAKNSSFDYIAMQFRLSPKMAMSAGFLPFSNVGYNFGTSKKMSSADQNNPNNTFTTQQTSFGSGGLHQIYVGAGYMPFKGLSVGANVSYLYGTISRSLSTTFDNQTIYPYTEKNELIVSSYKVDFGAQYSLNLGKKRVLNLGVVFSPGHGLNTDARRIRLSSNFEDTTTYNSGFDLPMSFGGGLTYVYDNRLTIGLDYSLQKWASAKFFGEKSLNDRSRISLGAEYIPSPNKRNYFGRIKYRAGAYYSDPYVNVADGSRADGSTIYNKGAREYGISAGLGLPVFKSKSILSISGQYTKVEARTPNMISENYLKLSIGITFNEAWFMKWKVE